MSHSNLNFWEQRYSTGTTPWDFHGVPPALTAYLKNRTTPGSVLIPGCGFGHEVRAFHEHGWQTLAIDYSPTAVDQAKANLGSLASWVRKADFFTDDLDGPFDLIYERTFLCAIDPEQRPTYANRMRQLIQPGGVLAGLFFYGEEPDGPPHSLADLTLAKRLLTGFELITDEPIPAADSLPLFVDRERWQVWRRL